MRLQIAILSSLALAGCSLFFGRDEPDPPASSNALTRSTWIVGAEGSAIGRVTFTETPSGVLIRLEFSDHSIPPGWHGVHVHQIGDCSDFAAGFVASGVHEGNVADVQHGLLSPAGPEAGDLPNIFAPPNGGAFGAEFLAPRLTLARERSGDRFPLLDGNGAALVVHASQDNHAAQPSGQSGPRIACAALTNSP